MATVLKETGKVIGEIEAYLEPDDDKNRDTFSPCWMLNKNYQGKGYAYEAAHAFLDDLFTKKEQDVFMHIQKIIMSQVSVYARN